MTTATQSNISSEPHRGSQQAEDQDLAPAQTRARRTWRRLFLRITSLKPNDVVRLLMAVGALIGLGWFIWYLRGAVTPFLVGAVLAYLMTPLVNRLNRRMPRWAAVLLVVGVSLLLLLVGLAFLVPALASQLNALLQALPSTARIEAWIEQLDAYLATLPAGMQRIIDEGIERVIATLRANSVEYIQRTVRFVISTILNVASTFTPLIGYVIVPFWLFFVLLDLDRGRQALDRLLPDWLRLDFWAVLQLSHRIVGSYFRGQQSNKEKVLVNGTVLKFLAGFTTVNNK